MSGIGEIMGGLSGMVLWHKRGERLLVSEVDGMTLVESDTPPQVLREMPPFGRFMEDEVRKHLPEGYVTHCQRAENADVMRATIWKMPPGAAMAGPESIVARADLGMMELIGWYNKGDSHTWRLELVKRLQADFDKRRRDGRRRALEAVERSE